MRRLASNLVVAVAALALAVGAAEMLVRWSGTVPPGGIATVSAADFARVPGLFTPGQDVVDRRMTLLPFRVRINDLGYRGPDIPQPRPADERRIVMVGDSFTFGDFVEDDETLPAQLEARLACAGAIRVINAGVGGSTIDTQAHMVERSLVLEPDLVVLTFYENDVADLGNPLWDQLARNRAVRSRFPVSVVYPVTRRLALWNLFLQVRARRQASQRVDAAGPAEAASGPDAARQVAELRSAYARRLADLAARLRERRIPFVFAAYPSHHSLREGARRADLAWVEETARGLGIDVVSFWDALRTAGRPIDELYALPYDGHPRAAGYGVAAEALAARLGQSGWLPRSCEVLAEPGAQEGGS